MQINCDQFPSHATYHPDEPCRPHIDVLRGQSGASCKDSEIADRCNTSLHHAAHVVQTLHAEGFVETLRGRTGGLRLAKPPDRINIGAMVRVFEQKIPIAECFDPRTHTCPLAGTCRLRSYIRRALDAFYHELDMVTLDDLVRGNCGLMELLGAVPDTGSARCSVPKA